MTPLVIFIALICSIPVCACIIYYSITYIKYRVNRNRQQYIERSKCIKQNHAICFNTALNYNKKYQGDLSNEKI